LPKGRFYLKIKLPPTADVFLPVQNVDADGRTPMQELSEGELLTLPVAWAVTAIALGGDVWLDEDRDEVKDSAEPLLVGITVLLYRSDSVLLSAGMSIPDIFLWTGLANAVATLAIFMAEPSYLQRFVAWLRGV
jgi:hypothetical protein